MEKNPQLAISGLTLRAKKNNLSENSFTKRLMRHYKRGEDKDETEQSTDEDDSV